uniref:Protein RFT1 homolog n=1 Tax=Panagrolaimus superbus TaxID=310955 RepID=A0A914YC46_9BILA
MATNFVDILRHHFSGQLGARLISFIITSILLRYVSISLTGLINVRMTLLYTTIGFLVREPFRKTCLSSDLSLLESRKYALLSIPFSLVVTLICCAIWHLFGCPESEFASQYSLLILIFASSAFIETLVEPCVIYALKTGDNVLFSYSQSILTLLQKLIVFGFILGSSVNHVTAFCIAQMSASLIFAGIYFIKWTRIKESSQSLSAIKYDRHYIKLLGWLIGHSIIKQLLTDGAGYVMVFTNVLSLKMQGVYDTVERLGSLATRIVLTPVEESAFIYFSSNLKRGGIDSSESQETLKKVSTTYFSLLRIIINLGLVVLVFGIPYATLVIRIYGGEQVAENNGGQMLMLYLVYLLIMAVNGITECFAFASMGTNEIMSHGKFLFMSFFIHYTLHIVLSHTIGPYGFIVSNCINSALRIAFNGHYIMKFLKLRLSYIATLLPSFKLISMLLGSFVVIVISSAIFGSQQFDLLHSLANVAVGGVLFLGVMAYLYQVEHLFTSILIKEE